MAVPSAPVRAVSPVARPAARRLHPPHAVARPVAVRDPRPKTTRAPEGVTLQRWLDLNA